MLPAHCMNMTRLVSMSHSSYDECFRGRDEHFTMRLQWRLARGGGNDPSQLNVRWHDLKLITHQCSKVPTNPGKLVVNSPVTKGQND
jgi:hypothetical protein